MGRNRFGRVSDSGGRIQRQLGFGNIRMLGLWMNIRARMWGVELIFSRNAIKGIISSEVKGNRKFSQGWGYRLEQIYRDVGGVEVEEVVEHNFPFWGSSEINYKTTKII